MKVNKKLSRILVILSIVLISMISFLGIYVQEKHEVKNILPDYQLGRDLKGSRRIELKVSEETETVSYDENGNKIEVDNTEAVAATTEEKPVNTEEMLTLENYQRSKQIIENRMEGMQLQDYIIRQDKMAGDMILEIPEDNKTDLVVSQLSMQGKFEMIDNETNEVLMTNEDVKKVEAGLGSTDGVSTVVFMNIQFNKQGTEKFETITNTYKETTQTVEATQEGQEATEETITKEIALQIDGSTLLTTHFDEPITNGILQLTVGSSSSSTTEQLEEYYQEAISMATLINSGNMPIIYTVEQNKFVKSDITNYELGLMISIAIVVCTIGMISIMIRYKAKGILASISFIGYVALLLLVIRFVNAEVTMAGLWAIAISIVLHYLLLFAILREEIVFNAVRKYALVFAPSFIISIVFTMMNFPMGVVLFWGITINLLYHMTISKLLLQEKE